MITTTPIALDASMLSTSVTVVVILLLLVLFIQKDLTASIKNSRAQILGKALRIAIVPLLIAFFLIAAFKLMEVWQ